MAFVLPNPTIGPDIDNAELLENFERIKTAFMGLTTFDAGTDTGPNFAAKYVDVPVVIGPFRSDDSVVPTLGGIHPNPTNVYQVFALPHFESQDPWIIKDILLSAEEIGGAGPATLLCQVQTAATAGGFPGTAEWATTIAFTGVPGWYASEPGPFNVTGANVDDRYMLVDIEPTGATPLGIWTNVTLSFTIRYLLSESTVG